MQFDSYAEVPQNVAKEIIAKATGRVSAAKRCTAAIKAAGAQAQSTESQSPIAPSGDEPDSPQEDTSGEGEVRAD